MKTIVQRSWIGLETEIVAAKNPALVGLRGIVVDETRNTVIIATQKGEKRVLKNQATFCVRYQGKTLRVDGTRLVGKIEDRIKK